MTGKKPSKADVTIVQRSVDSPSSRSARRNKIRSDTVTQTVASGATETGTIVTNTSAKDWMLYQVTAIVEESVSAGDVSVEIRVTDGDGDLIYGSAADGADGFIPFGDGGIVRSGWSIDFRITNNSGAGADVVLYPYLSRTALADDEDDESTTPDDEIDDFERTDPTSPYTSVDGNDNWAENTSDPYEGTKALEFVGESGTNGARASTISDEGDGLAGYPEPGDEFSFRFKGTDVSDTFRCGVHFGSDATLSDGYFARVTLGGSAIGIFEFTGGSSELLASTSERLNEGEYYRMNVEYDDTIVVRVFSQSGSDQLVSLSATPDDLHDNPGFGWGVESSENASNTVVFDDAKFR